MAGREFGSHQTLGPSPASCCPSYPTVSQRELHVHRFGCWGPSGGVCRPGRRLSIGKGLGGRNLLTPVAVSLNEPPPSLPPLSLALLKQAPGAQEADASEVCSRSCVQACALKGPACPPTQGHPGVHPGPRSPAPARTQMMLAHLHHARAQQAGRPELTRWGAGHSGLLPPCQGGPKPWGQAGKVTLLAESDGDWPPTRERGSLMAENWI